MNRKDTNFLKENGYFFFPKMLQLEITRKCPFHCIQCYKKHLQDQDMDYEYLSKIVEKAICNGVSLFTLNGGEPLLYPRIVDLLRLIGETNIQTNIFSSGFNLTKDIIDLLKEFNNLNFYISLNGSTREINNLSREGYDISIAAVSELSRNDVKYGINWVARHDNVQDFIYVLSFCVEKRASYLSVTSNKLTGLCEIQSPLDYNDLILLSEYIKGRSSLYPLIFIESCFSVLSTLIDGNKNNFASHCYAGISSCTVNCDYTFQPCTHLEYPEKFASLEDYWHNSNTLRELRNYPSKELVPCCNCKHNKICSLCRAMSVETYKSFRTGSRSCLNYQAK